MAHTTQSLPHRRAALRRLLLAAGGVAAGPALLHAALAADDRTGIRMLEGDVRIDDRPAELGQQVGLGQMVETGVGAKLVFVVGDDAFLLRESSRFTMVESEGVLLLRYLTGKVLSVFGEGRKQLDTPTATIGIRGTACYIEAEEARTYFCLCYGGALLIPKVDPNRRKALRTRHHEYPLYVGATAGPAAVLPAHVVNHSDEELTMLEALVERRPPFLDEPMRGSRY